MGSNILNSLISKLLKKPKSLRMGSFRIIRKRVVDVLKTNNTKTPALGAMLFKYTISIKNITVINEKREFGKSGYTIKRSFKLFLNYIINYSRLPLKFMSYIGFVSSFIGFALAVVYLIKYLSGSITIPGWTTLVILVLILGGLILLSLGIIGEYLSSPRSYPQFSRRCWCINNNSR